MTLTSEQKESVKQWVAAGASLSEVQTRLAAEFKIEMTYLDVRLLVLDLGATIQDKKEPKNVRSAAGEHAAADTPPAEPFASEAGEAAHPPAGVPAARSQAGEAARSQALSPVSVTVDTIVVPGAVASGTVRFSDGVTAKWVFDQMGRLGLEDVSKPGYQPSPADVAAFQQQLAAALRAKGMI